MSFQFDKFNFTALNHKHQHELASRNLKSLAHSTTPTISSHRQITSPCNSQYQHLRSTITFIPVLYQPASIPITLSSSAPISHLYIYLHHLTQAQHNPYTTPTALAQPFPLPSPLPYPPIQEPRKLTINRLFFVQQAVTPPQIILLGTNSQHPHPFLSPVVSMVRQQASWRLQTWASTRRGMRERRRRRRGCMVGGLWWWVWGDGWRCWTGR